MPRHQFTLAEIELALRKTGGLQTRAAAVLTASAPGRHITRQAIAKRIGNSDKLRAVVVDITEELKDLAEDRLIRNIKAGKERSVTWFLATKARDRGYGHAGIPVDEDGNLVGIAGATVHIYIPDNGRDPLIINAAPVGRSNGSAPTGNGLLTQNGPDPERGR